MKATMPIRTTRESPRLVEGLLWVSWIYAHSAFGVVDVELAEAGELYFVTAL